MECCVPIGCYGASCRMLLWPALDRPPFLSFNSFEYVGVIDTNKLHIMVHLIKIKLFFSSKSPT